MEALLAKYSGNYRVHNNVRKFTVKINTYSVKYLRGGLNTWTKTLKF